MHVHALHPGLSGEASLLPSKSTTGIIQEQAFLSPYAAASLSNTLLEQSLEHMPSMISRCACLVQSHRRSVADLGGGPRNLGMDPNSGL